MVGLLCKEALLYIVHLFLQLKARKARVLQTSLRILVDLIVDGVFSTCSCKFVYVFHISLMLLNWTDEVVKFELMFWHAQLFSLFNFNVFYCLERIRIVCLPSLASPLSSLIIHLRLRHQHSFLPCPLDPPVKTVLNPRTLNCTSTNCHQNPHKSSNQTPYQFTSLKSLLLIGQPNHIERSIESDPREPSHTS